MWSYPPPSKNFLFTENGDHYTKPQLDTKQISMDHKKSSTTGYLHIIGPVPMTQRASWKKGVQIGRARESGSLLSNSLCRNRSMNRTGTIEYQWTHIHRQQI